MDRLTRKSQSSEMVWFIDHDNNDLNLEPCEMSYSDSGKAIRKLAYYEDLEEQGMLAGERTFKEEDFTEEQLLLLRMAFKLVGDVVEMQRYNNYDVYMCNELYHLKEKLGIYDLVDPY